MKNQNTAGSDLDGAILGGTYVIELKFDRIIDQTLSYQMDDTLRSLEGNNKLVSPQIEGGQGYDYVRITFGLNDASKLNYSIYYTDYSSIFRPDESIDFNLSVYFFDEKPNCEMSCTYTPPAA